jgi:DNA-binding HxlR family transcriptional regulator
VIVLSGSSENGERQAWSPAVVRPLAYEISGRWALEVLYALREGPLRRNLLHERIGDVSSRVLTETLRRLESQRLIKRRTILSVPVEVDYELTVRGRRLWPLLHELHRWALDNAV